MVATNAVISFHLDDFGVSTACVREGDGEVVVGCALIGVDNNINLALAVIDPCRTSRSLQTVYPRPLYARWRKLLLLPAQSGEYRANIGVEIAIIRPSAHLSLAALAIDRDCTRTVDHVEALRRGEC